MSELGCVCYAGPSLLTGDPIVAIATGLDGGSMNPKTGPMIQTWILRADREPMRAVRDGTDDAICGECALRGDGASGRRCYVAPWVGPLNVYKRFRVGGYVDASWPDLHALVEGRAVRLGAYGDPAAAPFEVWRTLLMTASTWIGYTHQWRTCDARFQSLVMASVESEAGARDAWACGWRTFRIRESDARLLAGEFICPASDEAGHRTTCQACRLCRGTASPARSVVIEAHGHDGVMANFYRRKEEAIA